jgi:hypothetical protein
MLVDIAAQRLVEGNGLGSGREALRSGGLSRFDRIHAVEQRQSGRFCPNPRLGQANGVVWTEAEHVLAAVANVSEEPTGIA